ncbi:MAG: ABC transporter ATP-binding protein [Bacteroidia bacterium]|nr:ABC transporter ATP-binding protein [Bacteroidia bacterium]
MQEGAVFISLNNLGKKFGREWIFKNLNFEFAAGSKTVILGGNGSGKSTLLQVISGFVMPNEGKVNYSRNNEAIADDKIKNQISFASPYLQLVEDFTLTEMVGHAYAFKPFIQNIDPQKFIELIQLEAAKYKFIKQFSSGMKQRLKLGLAVLSDAPVLLLDEPVSNLDKNAIAWYRNLVTEYGKDKTVIVCSNAIEEEYFFCNSRLSVEDFKFRETRA